MDYQPYCYTALPETGGSDDAQYFRLLELLPGQSEEQVNIELHTFDVMKAPDFETISYSWTDDARSDKMICGGRVLRMAPYVLLVPLAVAQLLKELRSTESPRLLWIDIICINQADPPERSRQVNMMRHIYAHAVKTVVWLGPGDADSSRSFKVVAWLSAAAAHLTNCGLGDYVSTGGAVLRSSVQSYLEDRDGDKISLEETMHAMLRLLDCRWFERLWVVQEVAVSKTVVLRQGSLEVDWEVFQRATRLWFILWVSRLVTETSQASRRRSLQNITNTITMQGSRLDWQRGATLSLRSLLYRHRLARASDQRDKIYALVGLSDANETSSVAMIDYERSVSDAYRLWTIHILRHEGSLRYLSAANRYPTPHSRVKSSWVPDWSLEDDEWRLSVAQPSENTHATKDSELWLKITGNDTVLGLSGYIIDVIESAGLISTSTDHAKPIFGSQSIGKTFHIAEIDMDWERVARLHKSRWYGATGQSMYDAYQHAVTDGLYIRTSADSALIQESFRNWYLALQPYRQTRLLRFSRHLWAVCEYLLYRWQFWRTGEDRHAAQDRFFAQDSALKSVQALRRTPGRRMIRTKKGYIGLAAHGAKVGDSIALFQGGPTPLIIRPMRERRWAWTLVGDVDLHGVMQGELWDQQKCETFWMV